MKRLELVKHFLMDQILFTVIYVLAMCFVIGFYQMTTGNVELIYPILLAAFFYVVYLLIHLCQYYLFHKNLLRFSKNEVNALSAVKSYQEAYDTLHHIYKRYGAQIATLHQSELQNRRFISAFIHNMKTPVTVSSLLLQRAREGEITQDETLSGLDTELGRLTGQLNQLLELQRLVELQNDYEPKPVSLEEEVRKVVNENKGLFIHSHVYPKVTIGENVILTDPKWNGVVLQQIISNAVKYSHCEETRYVFFEAVTQGEYTKLIIQDQGVGIPDYDITRVFDPYFTGSNGRDGYQASGIGLYLCKQICDRLGHKIQIENDHGCKVTITYLSKL